MTVTYQIQIKSSWPGAIGGAIFTGHILGTRNSVTVKASYKILIRTPLAGEFWSITGDLISHEKYGRQLIATKCDISQLPRASYVSSLLCHHPHFRGFHFGSVKVRKLLKLVGSDTLVDLLNEGNISALSEILNLVVADKLVTRWASLKNEIDTYNFLRAHNFDAALSRKIICLSKKNTVERLKKNPYALICFGSTTKNIWRTVESVARKIGIEKDDERRLVAAVEHVLYERLFQGHTAIEEVLLELEVARFLSCKKLAKSAIRVAMHARAICITTLDNHTLIQLIGPAYIEHSIETRLNRLLSRESQQSLFDSNSLQLELALKLYSEEFSREFGFSLTKQQNEAIKLSLKERCSIISGFGGTGKTTVLKAIADIATSMNRTCYLMALSGKATERISQFAGHDAMTINAFIKSVQENSGHVDIHCDPLIMIDGASMVDAVLFNRLLSLFDGLPFSLLTIGDTAQLSPAGFGVVWHKLAATVAVKKIHMTEVHRNSANSLIHREVMRLRNNERHRLAKWEEQCEGIYLAQTPTESLIHSIIQIKSTLPDAQILTPHKSESMPDSTERINAVLQEKLNPLSVLVNGLRVGHFRIHEGDPVIITDNNYDLDLFYGMKGKLITVLQNSIGMPCGLFQFDNFDDQIELTVDQLFDVGIELAYAITVHKSQGSEYDQVILCCAAKSPLVEKSLLYTAVTRAKSLCVVVGSQAHYDHAANQRSRAESLCVGFNL